jgi:RND family efflux transporter MFP subunit
MVVAVIAAILSFYAMPSIAQRAGAAKRYDCLIQPKSIVNLGTAEKGVITEILVARGQVVRKGQVIAQLDPKLQELQAGLMRLRAGATAEIESSKARLTFRRTEAMRMGKLYRKNIISTKQLDEAEIELQLAKYNVRVAEMNRKISRIELQQTNERFARRTIRSPTRGVITEVRLSPGEYVSEQVSIVKIAEIDPLYVEVFLPVTLYKDIVLGTRALVFPQPPIGGRYDATVEVVDKVFDAASETFGLRLVMQNKDYQIPAGLRCEIEFLQASVQ